MGLRSCQNQSCRYGKTHHKRINMNEENKNLLDAHNKVIQSHNDGFWQSDVYEHYIVSYLNHTYGVGFIDLYNFKQFSLSRTNVTLTQPYQNNTSNNLHYFGISFIVSGHHTVQFEHIDDAIQLSKGQIWFYKGHLGEAKISLPEKEKISILSLYFGQEIFEHSHQLELFDDEAKRLLEMEAPSFVKVENLDPNIFLRVQQLLNRPSVRNSIELMQFEGDGLGILVDFLTKRKAEQLEVKDAIDMAVVILNSEFATSITTPQLSRRVGINECDLKKHFKQHTGKTIKSYILDKRMALAAELLKCDTPIQQVADQTGFSSKYYFKKVFDQYYGL